MESMKAKFTYFPFVIFTALFLNCTDANAQFFDFETFDGSISENTMPNSVLGNENVTLKALDFSGDTLWAGTYKDGLLKWWERGPKATAWFSVNALQGNEVFNIRAQASTRVFYTDFNSFTDEYIGFYRLRNQNSLDAPLIKKIEYMSVDTSETNRLPRVNDIDIVGDSLVLLATDSGLVMFNGVRGFKRRNPNNIATIEDWKIDQVAANSKGNLYLSSENRIYTENNGKWNKIDLGERPYRLRNTYVKSIKQGPGDTMWVVTTLAIVKIHSDTIVVWPNEEIKNRQNEVRDVAFDKFDNPWLIFELNGGVMFVDESTDKKQWLKINSTNSDLPDEVSCIAANESGDIYLGTDSDGLFKYLSYTPGSISTPWPNDVALYPSLSKNGIFTFENNAQEGFSLDVYDLQGKKISELQLASNQHTSISLSAGAYVVSIRNEKTASTKKIISIAP
jgi:hypothetical protein